MLTIRIDEVTKQDLERAAAAAGKSVSAFVLEASRMAAAKVPRDPPPKTNVFGGVPTYFRAHCHTAQSGGTSTYRNAGAVLAQHLLNEHLVPYDVEDEDEWLSDVERLYEMVGDGHWDDALVWWDEHYPKCMQLVPRRRRRPFIEGVYDTLAEHHGWCAREDL